MAKTGAHIALGPRTAYGLFCTSKPAVCIGVDDGGALLEAKIKSNNHTVTIFRDTSVYLEAPPNFNTAADMVALAQLWYPALRFKWEQNPADYYTITNEIGGGDGPDVPGNLTRLVAYEREIMRLANLDGYKVCVLNHATGSPGDFQVWKTISAPFIVEAWEAGNIYGRHVYGDGDLVDGSGNVLPGGPIRPFQELDYLRSLGAAGGVALTEVGLDGGFGYPGEQRTIAQMAGYEQALRLAGEFIGLCWWTLGAHDSNANWQNALPAAAQYNFDNPTPPWEWPDGTEEPTMEIKSFENGWVDLSNRLQQPNGMILSVIAAGAPLWYPGGSGKATGTVEAKHLICNQTLPANQCADGSDPLALDGPTTFKIQAVAMATGTSLKTTFTGTGRKRVTVPVNVHWQQDSPNEANDVYAVLLLNGVEVERLQHPELKDRQWHYMTGEADAPVTAEFRFQTSWANSRDCFTDKWTCEDVAPVDWHQQLWNIAKARQLVAFNPKAALQKKMIEHGFNVAETEFDYTRPDGTPIKAQLAIHPGDARRRVYYAVVPNWNDVQWFSDPAVSPTPPPFEFKAYPVQERPYTITSPFNAPRSYGLHEGIDLSAPMGQPILSVADGVVDYIRTSDISGYGLYVRVKHTERFRTWYAHLQSVGVAVGQPVTAGQVLGLADSTGNSTGSHLHLTVQDMEQGLDGYVVAKVVDPKPFLDALAPPPAGISMPPYFLPSSGDYGDICILANNWGEGDERQQLQRQGNLSYVTKNQNWERRRIAAEGIYLEMDTSPNENEYYTIEGSPWLPLSWLVGSEYTRGETVRFFRKSDCTQSQTPYSVTNKIKFAALHSTWTSPAGVNLSNVIELQWLIAGAVEEAYHFAPGKGLVGWANAAGKKSWVTEIIPVGQQQNNVREVIPCLN